MSNKRELTIVFPTSLALDAVSSLPRLSRSSPLPSPSEITTSGSFADLESWEQTARQHIELAKRAFESWEYHREHFAASEVDLVDRLEGRGEGPDGTDLARGAWEEVRLRGEKAEAVLKRMFPRSLICQCVSHADLKDRLVQSSFEDLISSPATPKTHFGYFTRMDVLTTATLDVEEADTVHLDHPTKDPMPKMTVIQDVPVVLTTLTRLAITPILTLTTLITLTTIDRITRRLLTIL